LAAGEGECGCSLFSLPLPLLAALVCVCLRPLLVPSRCFAPLCAAPSRCCLLVLLLLLLAAAASASIRVCVHTRALRSSLRSSCRCARPTRSLPLSSEEEVKKEDDFSTGPLSVLMQSVKQNTPVRRRRRRLSTDAIHRDRSAAQDLPLEPRRMVCRSGKACVLALAVLDDRRTLQLPPDHARFVQTRAMHAAPRRLLTPSLSLSLPCAACV
jgi:hypothetical protein